MDGYDTCPMTSVPAADVEGAVLDHVQKLLAAPELVARTWAVAKREGEDEITEREVTFLLADFAMVWNELFPAEQARIVQLLVERVECRRTHSRCGSALTDSPASLRNSGSRFRGERHDGARRETAAATLVVRIPMRFPRRGGQSASSRPNGSAIAPSPKRQPDGTLVKALARASRWQRMLEKGRFGTLAELADAEQISRSYVSRVLRLTLLAPDIRRAHSGRAADGRARGVPQAVSGRVGEAARAVPLKDLATIRDAATTACAGGVFASRSARSCASPSGG